MKFLSFLKPTKQTDFFIALIVSSSRVSAILFEEVDKILTILGTKEENLSAAADRVSQDGLIESADKAITGVEEFLPEGARVHKTIFGVPYHWVEEGRITKDYLLRLKKLCDMLELTPIGFLMPIEAIVHFLQEKEGAPVSAIFVELEGTRVVIYLIRAGNIIEVKSADIVDRFSKTVEKLLSEVRTFEVLPSRMILFDDANTEHIQQTFLSYPWTAHLPFLHLPGVVVLDKGFKNEAIIHGFATEMGLDVFAERGHKQYEPSAVGRESETEDLELQEEEHVGNTSGFVKEHDVIEEKGSFVEQEKEGDRQPVFPSRVPSFSRTFSGLRIINVSSIMKVIDETILFFTRSIRHGKKNIILIPVAAAILFIGFIVIYYYILLKAHIVLFLEKKLVQETFPVSISKTSGAGSSSSLSLLAHTFEITQGGNAQKAASGKKEVGNKAKGEVVIYNKIEQKKTFPKGSKIVGPNNLQFELVNDVTVASTSAFSTALSSVKADVGAVNFGPEYNVPSGTNFTFADFPTSAFFAKNESAFSGGTKKEILVVSKKDIDESLNQVIDTVKKKALMDAANSSDNDKVVLPESLSLEVLEKTFDKKEGDEAKTLNISAKVKFSFLYYKKEEFNQLTKEIADSNRYSGYTFVPEKSKIEMREIKIEKGDSAQGTLSVNLFYQPDIDKKKLKEDIVGKNEREARTVIHKISGVSEAKVTFENQLPIFPSFIPFNTENIEFVEKTNG